MRWKRYDVRFRDRATGHQMLASVVIEKRDWRVQSSVLFDVTMPEDALYRLQERRARWARLVQQRLFRPEAAS